MQNSILLDICKLSYYSIINLNKLFFIFPQEYTPKHIHKLLHNLQQPYELCD